MRSTFSGLAALGLSLLFVLTACGMEDPAPLEIDNGEATPKRGDPAKGGTPKFIGSWPLATPHGFGLQPSHTMLPQAIGVNAL